MKITGHKIDSVFVLLLYCIFAVSISVALALSCNLYKNITELSREGNDERTCLSYIWTKSKNHSGTASLIDYYGSSALCFSETYGDSSYVTLIYYYDGWTRELFFEEGLDFKPEDGLPLAKIDSLSFDEPEQGLIKASAGSTSIFFNVN